MAIKETDYKSMLKETVMLKHVGSGPVEKAPKETAVRDPADDSKGEGTQQAGTKSPNKIPAIAALKKELAKEGLNVQKVEDKRFMAVVESILSEIGREELKKIIESKSLSQVIAERIKEKFKK